MPGWSMPGWSVPGWTGSGWTGRTASCIRVTVSSSGPLSCGACRRKASMTGMCRSASSSFGSLPAWYAPIETRSRDFS